MNESDNITENEEVVAEAAEEVSKINRRSSC